MLPKDVKVGDAPTPRDPSIRVDDVGDGELLAVREFPGELTDLPKSCLPTAHDSVSER